MIRNIIQDLQAVIERSSLRIAALRKLEPKVNELNLYVSSCNEHLDFDNLEHADVIRVIAAFGGKWTKSPNSEGTINYVRDEDIDGIVIRCYAGAPPPSCKIIEVIEDVPEQITPATTRVVRKLVCKETELEESPTEEAPVL